MSCCIFFATSCGKQPNPSSTSSGTSEPYVEPKVKLEHNIKEYINNCYYPFSSSPYQGDSNILVVPVWFTDSNDYIIGSAKKDFILSDINDVFNKDRLDLGWYSVSSFYNQESLGKLNLTAIVSDWYECGKAHTYFAKSYETTTLLAKEVSDWYFNTTKANRKDFDADEDGYIDSIVMIYGCPNYVSLRDGTASNLWAYTSWIANKSAKSISKPGANVFMWASYDYMYGQEVVRQRTGSDYCYGDTRNASLDSHTYIHEFGHVLGVEDYYDYSDHRYVPAGGFSMQDNAIGGHDPYSTLVWEWSDVYMPKESVTLTIKDFQSSHDLILLSNHDVTSVFDEYILLELYTPTILNELDTKYPYARRYDCGPTIPGIRVWHIDSRLVYLTNPTSVDSNNITTDPTTTKGKYGVYLMESNSYDGSNASILGRNYYNYNIVQLIRNNLVETYKPKESIVNNDLFRKGYTFDMETFSQQFVKDTRLNNGKSFNWSFEVKDLSSSQATIKLTLN